MLWVIWQHRTNLKYSNLTLNMYNLHNKREVGINCLYRARNYVKAKNWVRAFPLYLMCLELFKNDRSKIEAEFVVVLYQLGLWLECRNKLTDVCKWYVLGMEYYPSNANIMNNFAEHLLRIAEPQMALLYLEAAHLIKPQLLTVAKNMTTAKLNILPRWHFRMLNDRRRNIAYKTALEMMVTCENSKVLDIGTGCGLLSFYASLCSAESILAVECSNALCTIAKQALGDRAKVINKYSTSLSIDIGLSNLLVTEIFDAGFFGEHVLEILIHAWNNLLSSSAKIIPNSADLFVTGFSSPEMILCHRLKLTNLGLTDVCVTQRMNEPYEAENLKLKPLVYVTNTVKACTVELNNETQLRNIYRKIDTISCFTVTCIKSGTIDAFAIWFNLYMDEAKTIMITTNPQEDSVTCWDQAVVYLDHPISVCEGDEISLQVSCVSNELRVTVLNPLISCSHCFKVSPEVITFLNDTQIIEAGLHFEIPKNLPKSNIHILDANPFPLFAFNLLKKGYKGKYRCILLDLQDSEFIRYLCQCNGFDDDCFDLYTNLDNEEFTESIDLIFLNPILKNGTLCERTFQQLPMLRNILSPTGCIYPKQFNLHIQIIESEYLEHCYKVKDDNLLGFKVAEELNKYAVLEHWEIEPKYFSYRILNQEDIPPVNLFTSDLKTEVEVHAKVTAGVPHAVLYWFTMDFSPVLLSTLKSVHYNTACFICQISDAVDEGKKLLLKVLHDNGVLKINAI